MTNYAQAQGTTLTWRDAGGDYDLTFNSMADGDGRQGEEVDLGANFSHRYAIEVRINPNVAPTAGELFKVFWSHSSDGTNYQAECTGSDAAFNDEEHAQRLTLVGVIYATNDTDPQQDAWVFFPFTRYGAPVVMNSLGQALDNASGHWLRLTPLEDNDQG